LKAYSWVTIEGVVPATPENIFNRIERVIEYDVSSTNPTKLHEYL